MKTLPTKPSRLQARVLRLLKKRAVDGVAQISTFQIADHLSVSRSGVQRSIEYLAKKQLIVVTPGVSTKDGKKIPSAFTFPNQN